MRPERRHLELVRPLDGFEPEVVEVRVEAALGALDTELTAAGRQAERVLRGRTQPTRWYSLDLRSRLLAAAASATGRD
jgi:hypothetical protein